jgi:thiol-disulfide isomerase/thioredoxin
MQTRHRTVFFSAALVLSLFATRADHVAAQDAGLDIGKTPPPVTLEDLDGKPVNLAQFVGKKPVLLEFWATWCPVCKALEPNMAAAHKRFGTNIEFLIIAVGINESPASIKRHLAAHPMPGRVLWDGKGAAVRAYEAPNTSYVALLDASGKVVYTGVGSDQNLVAAGEKALKPSTAPRKGAPGR